MPIRMPEKMTLMSLYPIGFVWYTISAKLSEFLICLTANNRQVYVDTYLHMLGCENREEYEGLCSGMNRNILTAERYPYRLL